MKLSNVLANVEANAIAPYFNNGYLRLYSGAQPADPETALSGNTLLAEIRFAATAFPAAVNGVLTANALTGTANAAATGTASFYRAFESDGVTVLTDGSVSTVAAGTGDCQMNSVAIQQNAAVNPSSFVHTISK